jgi:hypothetical protein
MNDRHRRPSSRWRLTVWFLLASTHFCLLTHGTYAQESAARRRSSIELAGYTRPGSPPDVVNDDGKILAPAFGGKDMKKFKVLGATIYFCVFKNVGADGDTFATGMADLDRRFNAGRSFTDAYSPRFDDKAKYLYLYQIVNDRYLNPQATPVKGQEKEGAVRNPLFDPNVKADLTTSIPATDPVQQFALKLLVDPRFITSWGHFRDAGFAANVVDVDNAGEPVKEVVDDGKKVQRDREIRLAFSYLPAITTKLRYPAYKEMAKPIPLGDLEKGFGVTNSGLNLKESKAYSDLKLVAGQIGKDNVQWASFVDRLIKTADQGRDPDFVQINYPKVDPNNPSDPGMPGPGYRHFADEVAYSMFRVTWLPGKSLKQGERSVLVGFTTDLPPVYAPVRADNDKSAEAGKELQLSGGPSGNVEKDGKPFADVGNKQHFTAFFGNDARAEADETFFTQAGGGEGSGSAFGTVPTPSPPPPPSPAGGSGGGGSGASMGGMGGGAPGGGGGGTGGGGGGFASPGWATGISRSIGAFGGGSGGDSGGGSGSGSATPTQQQASQNFGAQGQTINFNVNLTNQQQQQQQQWQLQHQHQKQDQGNNNNNHHGHGHHGHVVPAPASLLLALLGLPGLWFLRRRKPAVPAPDISAATLSLQK